MKKYLIINADDFGYCERRNAGILECHATKSISCATMMVNTEASKQAARMARDASLPAGLHLNMTEGRSLSDCGTLVDKDGFFLGMFGFRQAVYAGKVDMEQVQAEIEKQIEEFKKLIGYYPSHVDGHQHVHLLPGVREVFASVLQEHNIRTTRIPHETGLKDLPPGDITDLFNEVIQQAADSRDVMKEKNVMSTDTFVGLGTMGKFLGLDLTLEKLQASILHGFEMAAREQKSRDRKLTCELMVHPGYPSIPGQGGCGQGPDGFSLSEDRQLEVTILSSPEMHRFYKDNDIELINFGDLGEVR